jgi:hypothetical protein
MEWLAGLSAVGLLALCCGVKAVVLWLAMRAGARPPGQTPEGAAHPAASDSEVQQSRPFCPWC